jgi:hypothetical protein
MYAKERDETLQYRLSFYNENQGLKDRLKKTCSVPLRWSPIRVYGRSNSDGILRVVGFYNRVLFWGHGITIDSPINVSRLLDHTSDDNIEEEDVRVVIFLSLSLSLFSI